MFTFPLLTLENSRPKLNSIWTWDVCSQLKSKILNMLAVHPVLEKMQVLGNV